MNKYRFFLKILCVATLLLLQQGGVWANSKENLYFPLAWEITSQGVLNAQDFTNGTVSFDNVSMGKRVTFPLKKPIAKGKNQVAFLSPTALILPAGKYSKVQLSVQYKNQAPLTYDYNIRFDTVANKLTVLGGVFLQSKLNASNSNIDHKLLISLNKHSIDYTDIKKTIPKLQKEDINFNNSSSPRVLHRLDRKRRGDAAYYGTEIKMPCRYQGVVAVTFKHDNEPIEYYKELEISEGRCHTGEATYRGPMTFSLEKGTWTATSVTQVPRNKLRELGYDVLNRDPFRDHYQLEMRKFLSNNAYTKDLADEFQFTVDAEFYRKPFLYIGAFQPILKSDQTIESTLFKRSFALRDFRKVFGQRQVYNGYSGERLIHDKILGTISVLFHKVETSGTSFKSAQNTALKKITYCVNQSDKLNPLFEVNGSILMRQAESSNRKKSEFKFPNSARTVQHFQNCLASQFKSASSSLFGKELMIDAQIYGL